MPGYSNGQGMPVDRGGFFSRTSNGFANMNVVIASTTRDGLNSPTTYLRKGLVLTKYTSGTHTGKYGNYDKDATDGRQIEESAVILYVDIDVSDGEDHHAAATVQGEIDLDKLHWHDAADEAAFDWSGVGQRLITL